MMDILPRLYKAMTSQWTYKMVRWGIGILFFYAGAIKLMDTQSFVILIESFGLVPDRWLKPLAIGLPAFEIGAGIGLLFDRRGALAVISGLLLLFLALLGYGIRMGLDLDCGCFGPGDPEAGAFQGLRKAFYRDIFLVGGVFYLYWWRFRQSFEPARSGIFKRQNLRKETL